jgi:hypothetical protein
MSGTNVLLCTLFFVLLHLLIFPRSSSSLFSKKYTTIVTAFWICLDLPELFWLSSYWPIWVKRTHFFSMYFSPNRTANWREKIIQKGKCTTIAVTNLLQMQYVSNWDRKKQLGTSSKCHVKRINIKIYIFKFFKRKLPLYMSTPCHALPHIC